MTDEYSTLNNYLVEFFNEILRIEESALTSDSEDLSLRERHVIEAVINAGDLGMGNVASRLNITTGTLSTAIKTLEKKGFIERRRDTPDKRQVQLAVTGKGVHVNDRHQEFHHEMVSGIIESLSARELEIFMKGLEKLNTYFKGLK